ncbi:GntR family transcriptional regulator [Trabulsiella guamensis ATCC 49490]|uniref:GntR family transcriptional regulator n=1 Tax=Trabulsiella guamensis ATCC 49490 TaxID=1005994 RepID=A0A085A8K4_9ENTR|nr:GntR family transcriptional regulator [Trabulsiella guamensis]KFC06549.1 GntR family transcriptional regulator [Trabulsiella guamensis ATCC 49490]
MKAAQQLNIKIDETSTMPIYLQLTGAIKSAVNDGRLQPGDILPSERILVEQLGIARGTARKALQYLLEEGILVRNQGSGTFVAPHVRQSLPFLESFSEMAEATGGKATSELVAFVRRSATHDEQHILHLIDPRTEVVELTRLRKINGIAVSLQTAVIPADLLETIGEVEESLYVYLEKKGAPVIRAVQHFSAAIADEELVKRLSIGRNEPVLLVTRTGFTHNDRPVEHTRTWCINEYYDFTIELHRK